MDRKQMCGRLMAVGIPKSVASQVIDQVGRWAQCSGPEWTVARLKEIKLIFLHKLAKSDYKSDSWIALKGGLPKGPIRNLFRISSRKGLSKVLTALNGYTAFVSMQATKRQKEKFFSSMTSSDKKGLNARLKIVCFPSTVNPACRPPTLVEYCQSKTRGPGRFGRSAAETDHASMLWHTLTSDACRSLVFDHFALFNKVIPAEMVYNVQPAPHDNIAAHTLGSISGIQEPGFKLRAVANPDRTIQCVLEPLKRRLGDVLYRYVTNDCTFDQQKPLQVVQGWLRQGDTVHSVDLSDATNLFPWPLQKQLLLDSLHGSYHEMIEIMDKCATGPWHTRIRGELEEVRFTRGQPLGLGPSFFTFALAHNNLLEGLCRKHRLPRKYFILGDDIVIGNDRLHKLYRQVLDNYGCKVSESKTFSSKCLAEFAGYTITPTVIAKGFKWRSVSDASFLECLKAFGKDGLALCTPSQRVIAKLLSDIPRQYGGLGWSEGKTLTEFFNSRKGQLLCEKLLKPEGEVPLVFRDLTADLLELHRAIASDPGYNADSFAMSMFPGLEFRNSKVSDFMDIDLPETGSRPRSVYLDLENYATIPDFVKSGYYPVLPRIGDPRPQAYPLVRSYISLLETLPKDEQRLLTRWVKLNELSHSRVKREPHLGKGPSKGGGHEVKADEISVKPVIDDAPIRGFRR
nr:RNA-dependent RNA polymerase [Mute swan feces associated narna-like virus 3]